MEHSSSGLSHSFFVEANTEPTTSATPANVGLIVAISVIIAALKITTEDALGSITN